MSTNELRERLAKLRPDSDHDTVLAFWLDVLAELEAAKSLKADAEAWLRDWIQTNGRELVFITHPGQVSPEDKRWYVKQDRKIRQRTSVSQLLDDLLFVAGGDVQAVAEAMSSDPFKQGHIKSEFGEAFWSEHYRVDEIPELKDGKPTGEQRKVLAQEVVAFMAPDRRKRFEERMAG